MNSGKAPAIFASAFYPSLGGVEELVRQLAHAFAARGTSPVVVTERWPRSLPAYEEYEGIPVFRLPMRVPDGAWRAHLMFQLTHRQIRRELLQALRRRKVDLLHVQCVSSTALYALATRQALGLPLVVSLQGELTMDAGGLFQRSAFAQQLMRRVLAEADWITACSRQTLHEAQQFAGRDLGERAEVVYNGIRVADFQGVAAHQHPRPYVLAMGRHVPQKGFDVLLQAFAGLCAGGRNAGHDLLLAGDGDERPRLERLTAELRIGDKVHFLGRVDRPAAVRLFTGCSFFVLPSRHEPMGIVNLEAMAAGKAVVASRVGGVPELVEDGRTGLLVPGGDPVALCEAMARLTADPTYRVALGTAGRERALEFDWQGIAAQYAAVYERARACRNSRGTAAAP